MSCKTSFTFTNFIPSFVKRKKEILVLEPFLNQCF